jgi:hypothetical protein
MRSSLNYFRSLFVLLVLSGCTTSQVEKTIISATARIDVTTDGLSVTSIVIDPLDFDLGEQLSKFGKPIKDEILANKLLLEGIHVIEIESIDVPAIATSIGKIVTEEFVWHGQIHQWRDVRQRVIPRGGMIITTEGIPYLIEGGYLSILTRSWLVEREDGLFVYLQAMPTWHMPKSRTGFLRQSENLVQNKVFSELILEAMLQDSQALLIAVELSPNASQTGPFDEGRPAVRLGEALMGGPVTKRSVVLLVLEANLKLQ